MVFSATSSIQDGHFFFFLASTLPCWCYLPECGLFSGLRAWPSPDDRFIHSTRSQRRLALGTMCVPFLPEISFTRGSWLVVLVESELAFFFASWSTQEQVESLWLGWKCPETTTKTMTKEKDKDRYKDKDKYAIWRIGWHSWGQKKRVPVCELAQTGEVALIESWIQMVGHP